MWEGTAFTTDGYSEEKQLVLHVLNVAVPSEQKARLLACFVRERLRWGRRQAPPGTRHHLRFDVRGQDVPEEALAVLRLELTAPR